MLDVFNQDAFQTVSLTASINKLPFAPGRIDRLGLFRKRGITTTTAVIEERDGVLHLLQTAQRGTMTYASKEASRKARSFVIPHIPFNDVVYAADVQGIREFGQEASLETVAGVVNDKLEVMRQSHEVTHEYHRIGALSGIVLDADGSTIYDWFTEFGLTETVQNFVFSVATTDIKAACTAVIRAITSSLGATPITGVRCFAGDTWFDAFVSHAEVKAAFERYQENQFARTQQLGEGGFTFAGITFENYTGSLGATSFIDTDTARFFPTGVPGLFDEIWAPANFIEAVNTKGLPVYAKQERMKFDVGVELHTQSNPLLMPTRPQCLVKGTHS